MNVDVGFKTIIKYPLILVLPVVLQVMISFVMSLGIMLGVDIAPEWSMGAEENHDVSFMFTLPLFIPLISDIDQSFTFLTPSGDGNWLMVILYFVIYLALISFAIAMYLGIIKKVLYPDSENRRSLLQLGLYYFFRIYLFQFFNLVILFGSVVVLTLIFFPLGLIGFFLFIIYSLTPYIIVLEDKSFGEAISNSPRYMKRYFKKFLPLALGASITTLFISLLLQGFVHEGLQYYAALVLYTFIGSGFIVAFFYLLNNCIKEEDVEPSQITYPKWKRWVMFILLFSLPWLGAKFANGEHVTAIQFKENTSLNNGIYYHSNWSGAFYGSDHTYTTYGFEIDPSFKLTMPLPNSDSGKESIFGKGEVTWKVDKEKSETNGNHTTYYGEEELVTSEFIYRLDRTTINGIDYYSSQNGGFVKLLTPNQSDEPMGMHIFVMNDGNDVFVYQYKQRFDPKPVIRIDDNGQYFLPLTSPTNPLDFKHFWYSRNAITKERILDFLHSKNNLNMPISVNPDLIYFESIVAALLQEANGEGLVRFDENIQHLNITTNIATKSAEQWSEVSEQLYGDTDMFTFLTYLNRMNEYDGYEPIGWTDEEKNEYQLTVPFPRGDIIINCTRVDGILTEVEIVIPEEL